MRNKHDQPGGYTQPPCVHIMLDWDGEGYLVEVMLILTLFLEIKKVQHLAYEVKRVDHVLDLVAGLDTEDENTKLKRENAEKDACSAGPRAPQRGHWTCAQESPGFLACWRRSASL